MILAAALASMALSAPIDRQDTEALVSQARVWQRYWRYEETIAATTAHFETARLAAEAICRDQPRELFMLYGAVVGVESDARWITHDHGKGLGWIGCTPNEVYAAASHLGIRCGTDRERAAVWVRFGKDRTFAVWVEVRHLARLVDEASGDWLTAMARHNGSKRYGGDVLLCWYRTWLEPAPILMAIP